MPSKINKELKGFELGSLKSLLQPSIKSSVSAMILSILLTLPQGVDGKQENQQLHKELESGQNMGIMEASKEIVLFLTDILGTDKDNITINDGKLSEWYLKYVKLKPSFGPHLEASMRIMLMDKYMTIFKSGFKTKSYKDLEEVQKILDTLTGNKNTYQWGKGIPGPEYKKTTNVKLIIEGSIYKFEKTRRVLKDPIMLNNKELIDLITSFISDIPTNEEAGKIILNLKAQINKLKGTNLGLERTLGEISSQLDIEKKAHESTKLKHKGEIEAKENELKKIIEGLIVEYHGNQKGEDEIDITSMISELRKGYKLKSILLEFQKGYKKGDNEGIIPRLKRENEEQIKILEGEKSKKEDQILKLKGDNTDLVIEAKKELKELMEAAIIEYYGNKDDGEQVNIDLKISQLRKGHKKGLVEGVIPKLKKKHDKKVSELNLVIDGLQTKYDSQKRLVGTQAKANKLEVEGLDKKIAALNQASIDRNSAMLILEQVIKDLRQELTDTQNELAKVQSEKEGLIGDNQQLASDYTDLSAGSQELLDQASNNNNIDKKRIEKLEELETSLRKKIKDGEREKKDLQKEIDRLVVFENKKLDFDFQIQQIETLKQSILDWESKYNEKLAINEGMLEELVRLRQIEQTEIINEEKKEEEQRVKDELKRVKEEKVIDKARIKELEESERLLGEEIKGLNTTLVGLRSQITANGGNMQSIGESIETIEKRVKQEVKTQLDAAEEQAEKDKLQAKKDLKIITDLNAQIKKMGLDFQTKLEKVRSDSQLEKKNALKAQEKRIMFGE